MSRALGWGCLLVIGCSLPWVLSLTASDGDVELEYTLIGDDEVSLTNSPPVVINSTPRAGATDVDPQLTEIKVTFSKDMQPRSWSWVRRTLHSFPETTGDSRYLDDQRTCVLPVKLQPGKTYALWLNGRQFHHFRDTDGLSAVPYLLVFRTAPANTKATSEKTR